MKFIVVTLLAVAGYGAANPLGIRSCDLSFIPCTTPMIMFIMGPEGQQLAQLKDGLGITEQHLKSICRVGKEMLTCANTAIGECVPRDALDVHELGVALVKLMEVCDRPDLYNKTRTLMQCGKTLNQTGGSKTRACGNRAVRLYNEQARTTPQSGDGLAEWRNGTIMKDICCNIKSTKACSGTEVVDKCGREAQQIVDDVLDAVVEALKCNGPRGENCPVLAPPTAEDEALDVKNMVHVFPIPGTGGPGGPM
ncbi:uncharacterized protein LOC129596243 [Paramacrobiotus metropolitanus]|uniref:uncharacterized protein LOC129596243 n=1 Tax=Paramacrobiotus metropolitanus TaxID=2943436 RepID=UPI0024462CF9|nr:uncharacterized protein LOC129596243 [Paramacrobiotus metropolitanus]